MLELSAWRESWNKLRGEWETQSFANPQVNLCRWKDSEVSPAKITFRMDTVLRLTEHWTTPVYPIPGCRKARKTQTPRMIVMGMGNRHGNGDGVWYWLMHERLARAAQHHPIDNTKVATELDRTNEADTIFQALGDRAGNLLRQIPDGAGLRLADNAIGIGCRLWIEALFGHAFDLRDKAVRVSQSLPNYVPRNCQWDWDLGQPEVIDNPFAASLSLIEALTRDVESSLSLLPTEAREKFCFEQWEAGKSYKEINAALKRHPEWECFEDERAVRKPINAWAKRIKATPRKGQPGRRPK